MMESIISPHQLGIPLNDKAMDYLSNSRKQIEKLWLGELFWMHLSPVGSVGRSSRRKWRSPGGRKVWWRFLGTLYWCERSHWRGSTFGSIFGHLNSISSHKDPLHSSYVRSSEKNLIWLPLLLHITVGSQCTPPSAGFYVRDCLKKYTVRQPISVRYVTTPRDFRNTVVGIVSTVYWHYVQNFSFTATVLLCFHFQMEWWGSREPCECCPIVSYSGISHFIIVSTVIRIVYYSYFLNILAPEYFISVLVSDGT